MSSIPKIDFNGLDLSKAGTEAWVATRAKVIDALDTVGFFTAVFDEVPGELLDELFGPVGELLFKFPAEVRLKVTPNKEPYYKEYEDPGYASFLIEKTPQNLETVEAFTKQLWPQGNPAVCETLWGCARKLSMLEMMIRRLIAEGLGVEENLDAFLESTNQGFRISEYTAPQDQETMVALRAHVDPNLMTIIYQRHGDGLEMRTKGGDWLRASPDTISVVPGESFEIWSNRRIKCTEHRVKMTNNETRYSVLLGSQFNLGCPIEVPRELTNRENPKLFNAFEYASYMLFRFSMKGHTAKDPLKTFCGVNGDDDRSLAGV